MQAPLIYLDYAATTPVDPEVAAAMSQNLLSEAEGGNAASFFHRYGQQAREKIETARAAVAALFGAMPQEVFFTSGATESNNWALMGCAKAYRDRGRHIVTMSTEHASVLEACRFLQTQGFEVSYIPPLPDGRLDLDRFKKTLHSGTILISVMHANNETGVLQDIAYIGRLAQLVGSKFHVDATQTAGKIPIDWQQWPIDLLSFSAHKFYGPKGIGGLLIRQRPRCRIAPWLYGGGQERGLRAGTLPTHQIWGLGVAAQLAVARMAEDRKTMEAVRAALWQGLAGIPGTQFYSQPDGLPYMANVRFEGVMAEHMRTHLQHIAISGGSACHSAAVMPSHVLTAMGVPHQEALGAVRLSWGRGITPAHIHQAVAEIAQVVHAIRAQNNNPFLAMETMHRMPEGIYGH